MLELHCHEFLFVPAVSFPVTAHPWEYFGPVLYILPPDTFAHCWAFTSPSQTVTDLILSSCDVIQSSNYLHGTSLDSLQSFTCLSCTGEPRTESSIPNVAHHFLTDTNHYLPWSFGIALLMQPRILLAFFGSRASCWLIFSFLSTKTPGFFFTNLLSRFPDLPL